MTYKTYKNKSFIADRLSGICGHSNVATDQQEMFHLGFSQAAKPEVIVRPGRVEEIREIVSFAMDSSTSIIPIGGGTQIRQALTESQAGIGLCMDRFDRIHEFEVGNLSITAEAGTLNSTIQKTANAENLQLAVNADVNTSTIGGEVATNFSSLKRYKYGAIRDYVLGLTFISPTGKFVKTGGKTVKNTSGYDFTKLLSGSWGTMGILYSITLKLNPLPEKEIMMVRNFSAADDAIEEGMQIISKKSGISSCNIFKDTEREDSSLTMALSLEGSTEFIDAQIKHLNLPSSWKIMTDQPALLSVRTSLLKTRKEMKREYFNTVIIDKRAIPLSTNSLQFLIQQGCLFDFDIAAGVLEFSVPGNSEASANPFWKQWSSVMEGLHGKAISFLPNGSSSPLLGRLLPTIDPHKIMFRNNIFSRRYHLG